MTQFSPSDYMAEQIQEALYALHHIDGYPIDLMADYAGCAESTMYTYHREVPANGYRAQYIDALRATMLRKHRNIRLFKHLLPPGVQLSFEESRHNQANGCIDDENSEMTLVQAQMIVAHRANNPDALEEAAEKAEEVIRRARHEADLLRGGRSRLGKAS